MIIRRVRKVAPVGNERQLPLRIATWVNLLVSCLLPESTQFKGVGPPYLGHVIGKARHHLLGRQCAIYEAIHSHLRVTRPTPVPYRWHLVRPILKDALIGIS